MSKILVIVPTYNEAENIRPLAQALLALPVMGIEVLVVDDNSPDGTGQIADELVQRTGGCVHVMHREGKNGLGTAYIQGFKWAIQRGYDIIVQMDADFSHSPSYIPQMLEQLKECDAVIGSRYAKGGRLDERWGPARRLLSWWANSVWVPTILQIPIRDATGGFRAWRASTLIGMDLNRIRSNGYVFMVEVAYIALQLGYKFREVPIYFEDRRYGKSKMSLKIQIEAALRVVELRRWHHSLAHEARQAVLENH